jgi:hypothetical protein
MAYSPSSFGIGADPTLHASCAIAAGVRSKRIPRRLGAVTNAAHHGVVLRQELRHEHRCVYDTEGIRIRTIVGKARNRWNDSCLANRIPSARRSAVYRIPRGLGGGLRHLALITDTHDRRGFIHD